MERLTDFLILKIESYMPLSRLARFVRVNRKINSLSKKFLLRSKASFPGALRLAIRYEDRKLIKYLIVTYGLEDMIRYMVKYSDRKTFRYLKRKNIPYDSYTLAFWSAHYGNLKFFKYALKGEMRWRGIIKQAIYSNNPDLLQFLYDRGYLVLNDRHIILALRKGKLESLQWMEDYYDLSFLHEIKLKRKWKKFLLFYNFLSLSISHSPDDERGSKSFSSISQWSDGSVSSTKLDNSMELTKKEVIEGDIDTDFE